MSRTVVHKRALGEDILIAGPTTLWALLATLQMGFRTLAIEKHSRLRNFC